jgi:uncharacterized protein YprB with RNaseH-like and TPR domain
MPSTERKSFADPRQQSSFDVQYKLVSDALSLHAALSPLYTAKVYGLDCETTGLDPRQHRLRLVQIATDDQPVVIVDLAAIPRSGLKPLRKLLCGQSHQNITERQVRLAIPHYG